MPKRSYPVTGEVKIFPMENPWIFVSVPKKYTDLFRKKANRGLVPITITLGGTTWDTSLLPMGNGKQFIPLKKQVRKAEKITVGDKITLSFVLRT